MPEERGKMIFLMLWAMISQLTFTSASLLSLQPDNASRSPHGRYLDLPITNEVFFQVSICI